VLLFDNSQQIALSRDATRLQYRRALPGLTAIDRGLPLLTAQAKCGTKPNLALEELPQRS
jgi:hypothetical protein